MGTILIDSDQANQSISDTDRKAQGLGGTFGNFAKWAGGAALAIGGIALAVGGLAVKFTDGLKGALNGVQAQTGATDEEMIGMKDTMLEIYNANLGENFEDIGRAIAEIGKQTGATGEELKSMTKNALLLRDTFEFEVTESTRTADMMMKQFGITSDEAYNLIAQGAQKGLDKNKNLLDTINEYSVHFKQLGFNSEEMFNMLSNGAATGVYDIDKLGDAMKEFGIRSKDGSKASSEGFKTLGLDAVAMTAEFAKGGDASKAAFAKVAEALFALEDPVAKEAAGVALFGTMWEDVGVKGMEALVSTKGEINNNIDALGKINEVKYDTFGQAIQGIKRNLETGILLPIGEKILPVLNEFASWITANMPTIQNEISFAMNVVGEILNKVVDIVKTYILPQFVAFGNLIKENMPAIKAAIQAMYDYVKPSFDRLVEAIKTNLMPIIQGLWELIQKAMPTIRVIFEVAMIAVGLALKIVIDTISLFINAAKGIYDFIKPGLDLVIDIFNKVGEKIQWALDKLRFWNNEPAQSKTVKIESEDIGNNALGTDYWRGGLTWVGEKGVELVNLPRGSQVIPNNEIGKDMFSQSHSETIINFADLFRGANFYVRSDNDIKRISQELYNLQRRKARGLGIVPG